jgi:hypothetical protein
MPSRSSSQDARARARARDETAFARIITAHHDDMTRVCFVICGVDDRVTVTILGAGPDHGPEAPVRFRPRT